MTKNEVAVLKNTYIAKLSILPYSLDKTTRLLQAFPLTETELRDVTPLSLNKAVDIIEGSSIFQMIKVFFFLLKQAVILGQRLHADCIHSFIPIVPPPLKPCALLEERKRLPTWLHRSEIIDVISKNQVIK